MKMAKLDTAVIYLMTLVAAGADYADAEWAACNRYNIDSREMRKAYDKACCVDAIDNVNR